MVKNIFLFMVLILFGCSHKNTNVQLINTKWKVVKLNSDKVHKDAYISFENDNANAYVGCNIINFKFTHDKAKQTINVGNVFSTRKYCKDLSELEGKFVDFLGKIKSYKFTRSGKLILSKENGTTIECESLSLGDFKK